MEALDSMNAMVTRGVVAAMRWSDPWWWLWTAAALTTLSLLNILPLRVPPAKETEYGLYDLLKIGLRNLAVYSLVVLVLLYWPAMYFASVAALGSDAGQGHDWFFRYLSHQAATWGWLLAAGVVGGLAWRVIAARYLTPRLSQLVQRIIVRQEDHKQSDMRVEMGKLKTRDFKPRQYYKPEQIGRASCRERV